MSASPVFDYSALAVGAGEVHGYVVQMLRDADLAHPPATRRETAPFLERWLKLTVEGGGYDEQTAQKLQALTDYMCEDDATVEEFARRARETRNDLVKSGEHGLGLAIAGIALQSSQNALLEQQSSHDRPSQHGGTGRQPVPGSSSDTGTTTSSSSATASGVSYVGTPWAEALEV